MAPEDLVGRRSAVSRRIAALAFALVLAAMLARVLTLPLPAPHWFAELGVGVFALVYGVIVIRFLDRGWMRGDVVVILRGAVASLIAGSFVALASGYLDGIDILASLAFTAIVVGTPPAARARAVAARSALVLGGFSLLWLLWHLGDVPTLLVVIALMVATQLVALAQILARKVLLVVQGRELDRDSADPHRLELGIRVQVAELADVPVHREQARLRRGRRELPGDRPAWITPDRTEPTLNTSIPGDPRDTATPWGMVGDLRHNGGGFLNEAIDLTGLFVHRGPVVQVKDYANEIQVDSEKEERLSYSGPMAVLVDRFSASASEIVAGALQNYGRAIIIGDHSTHGKGTVQTVLEMKNLSQALAASKEKTGAAKITIQKFYLPDGASTQLKGVIPDIVMPSVDDFLPIGESDLPHALP